MSSQYLSPFLNQAGVRCFNVPGSQEELANQGHLSNAITVPLNAVVVHITGQVGNLDNGDIPTDYREEYRQAFENVKAVLQAAGVEAGWQAVYKVHFLTLDASAERLGVWLKNIKDYCGDTRPTTMAIGVKEIAWPGATLEIFVEAIKQL
ncbi:NADP-specific glutamate dehydrogenase [Colletotrichum sp. SAR11_239]|nr:NADP-specific glutamate dehydrogenase [Colletotrichum sp. SAR11_239]